MIFVPSLASLGLQGDPFMPLSTAQQQQQPQLRLPAQAGPRQTAFARALAHATAAHARQTHQPSRYQHINRTTSTTGRLANQTARPTPSTRSSVPQPARAAATAPAAPERSAERVERAPGATDAAPSSMPLPLDAYPHPNGDNGRGMHWVPTTSQTPSTVDRFVAEAQRMGVKWVTFLNDGASIGPNDYLVKKLTAAGIEPIMRIWTPTLAPIAGDLEGMVRHYVGLGVHYFQPFNEPNLRTEQPGGSVSVDRYLDNWIPAAQVILRGGGLPGFGSMAPGGDIDDVEFLRQVLAGLRQRGALGLLDRAWLSMHNYTLNYPVDSQLGSASGGNGFVKFRTYHQVLHDALGRDLPIIGTEGGTFVGEHEDPGQPKVDQAGAVAMVRQAYTYMAQHREPWNFAYSYWVIANEAGGGTDRHFTQQALFRGDGTASSIVDALRSLPA